MGRKKTRLGDNTPIGIPDRKPKSTKRACEACAVVGPKATLQLCLRRTGKPPGNPLNNKADVCAFMRGLETADRESFYALHLDTRHHVVDIDKVSTGSQTGVEVHPREVFKSALLSGAQALIFVHNHPSGNPDPSYQDKDLTTRLKAVGDTIGISVLDHVIVGHDLQSGAPICTSFAAKGLLGAELKGDYPLLAKKGER